MKHFNAISCNQVTDLPPELLAKLVKHSTLSSTLSFFKTCKTLHGDKVLREVAEEKRRIVEIFCGENHSMLLGENGEVHTCGHNCNGQLGLGHRDDINIFTPVKLAAGIRIKQLACGENHSMLLGESGKVYTWGRNVCDLDLPRSAFQDRDIVTCVEIKFAAGGMGVKQLACGLLHTMLLDESGEVYACGFNDDGQLGLDTWESTQVVQCVGLPAGMWVKQLACGEFHTMLLDESGEVYACGFNVGQLGLGHNDDINIFTPVKLAAGIRIKQLACGENHSMLLGENGEVYACGYNCNGQLGLGLGEEDDRDVFTLVESGLASGTRGKQLVCDGSHTMLICENGEVYACGCNVDGQLGLGHSDDINIFTRVKLEASIRVKQLVYNKACYDFRKYWRYIYGKTYTMLLCERGEVYACGRNQDGQLGLGHSYDQNIFTPVELEASIRVKQLACGQSHTVLLCESGKVYACGKNVNGQLGLGDRCCQDTFTRVKDAPRWTWVDLDAHNSSSMSVS